MLITKKQIREHFAIWHIRSFIRNVLATNKSVSTEYLHAIAEKLHSLHPCVSRGLRDLLPMDDDSTDG